MSRSDGSTADYYELPKGCTELQDLISYRNLNAQDGEIFRAIYRKGLASHSDTLRDARKVLFYAGAEVKRLEKLVDRDKPAISPACAHVDSIPLCAVIIDGSGRRFTNEEPAAAIDDDSDRQQILQQNGEMAAEVYAAIDAPSWKTAPEWAQWLAQDAYDWCWYALEPTEMNSRNWNRGMDERKGQKFQFCAGEGRAGERHDTRPLYKQVRPKQEA